jgi:hypothetical protein
VEVGSSRDTDRLHGIVKGKLLLTREEVGAPFEDVTKKIVASCLELLNGRKVQVCLIFFVMSRGEPYSACLVYHPGRWFRRVTLSQEGAFRAFPSTWSIHHHASGKHQKLGSAREGVGR